WRAKASLGESMEARRQFCCSNEAARGAASPQALIGGPPYGRKLADVLGASLLRLRRGIAWQRLQQADAIAFGVEEGNVLTDTWDEHRLTQNFAAGLVHFLHAFMNVFDRNDDGRILCRPIGLLLEEATIDRTMPA